MHIDENIGIDNETNKKIRKLCLKKRFKPIRYLATHFSTFIILLFLLIIGVAHIFFIGFKPDLEQDPFFLDKCEDGRILCSDFLTSTAAEKNGCDTLDGDNDGIYCEHLPNGYILFIGTIIFIIFIIQGYNTLVDRHKKGIGLINDHMLRHYEYICNNTGANDFINKYKGTRNNGYSPSLKFSSMNLDQLNYTLEKGLNIIKILDEQVEKCKNHIIDNYSELYLNRFDGYTKNTSDSIWMPDTYISEGGFGNSYDDCTESYEIQKILMDIRNQIQFLNEQKKYNNSFNNNYY